ncbi:MAG: hypothetical protein ACOCXU_04885 [Coleofasciculus sp.]
MYANGLKGLREWKLPVETRHGASLLPGIEATQSRQVAKPSDRSRRGKTRKAKS